MKNKIFVLFKKLIPVYRTLAGPGNLKVLNIISSFSHKLKILNFKSGKRVFDWTIPKEWIVKDAYIKDLEGRKIVDFNKNNLHVVVNSISINKSLSLKLLKKKIYSHAILKNAIPYVTSYYKKDWGFCLSQNHLKTLKNKIYKVFINSKFKKGYLRVGEILIKGKFKKEIVFSTYICHPFMANNETAAPAILAIISKWLSKKKTKYSYRIIFSSETIGTIAYLKKFKQILTKNVIAGYVVTCFGDKGQFSYLKSKYPYYSLSDKMAIKTFKKLKIKNKFYSWKDRGSDERQYNSPGVNLNFGTLMRTKFLSYKEYHTSLDKTNITVTKNSLIKSYIFLQKLIENYEKTIIPYPLIKCEPFLTKKKLYRTNSQFKNSEYTKKLLNIMSFCDGKNTAEDIGKYTNISNNQVKKILMKLKTFKYIDF